MKYRQLGGSTHKAVHFIVEDAEMICERRYKYDARACINLLETGETDPPLPARVAPEKHSCARLSHRSVQLRGRDNAGRATGVKILIGALIVVDLAIFGAFCYRVTQPISPDRSSRAAEELPPIVCSGDLWSFTNG
jgi:hypothetical protein